MGEKGFTLIEVIVAIALLLTLSVGVISARELLGKGINQATTRIEARELAIEASEAVMAIRAEDFPALALGTYYPQRLGGRWVLTAGEEVIEEYTRRIIIENVFRSLVCEEAVCNIVQAGGIADEGSFWVTVEVEWNEAAGTEKVTFKNLVTYWR